MEMTVRVIEPGHHLLVTELGHDLIVTRVERFGGLAWVEGFDPDDLYGVVPTRWVSTIIDDNVDHLVLV